MIDYITKTISFTYETQITAVSLSPSIFV